MGAIFLGTQPCSGARLTCPRRGSWSADVDMPAAVVLSGQMTLAIGKRKLFGTIARTAVYGGSTKARLVGGYGGWRTMIPAKSYDHDVGLRRSTILSEAARACGEKIGTVANDDVVGAFWVREENIAERQLELLASDWYIDDLGVTQIHSRPTGRISSAFTVSDRSPDSGRIEIATEAFEDWIPGRSFLSPTTPDEQTISLVTIDATNGQTPRVSVLIGPSAQDRMLDDLRAIIRAELSQLTYAGVWSYSIIDGDASSGITATPIANPHLPPIKNCPLLPGVLGESVDPTPGTTCYVIFADLSPAKPFVAHIAGISLTATIEATTSASISAAILKLNNGAQPVARLGDTVAGILAITSGNPTILG